MILQKGQAVAGEIFREAGIELRWTQCPCEPSPDVMSFYLRIIPKLFGSTMSEFRSDHLGFAAVNEEGGELATIFYDRIESQTRGGDPSSLLGLAMAHELGPPTSCWDRMHTQRKALCDPGGLARIEVRHIAAVSALVPNNLKRCAIAW